MGIAWLALGRRNCKCSVFQPLLGNSELTAIHS